MALPVELRCFIYKHLLIARADIRFGYHSKRGLTPNEHKNTRIFMAPRNIEVAIVSVCKDCYKEAIPILYSENIFCFERSQYGPSTLQ
jgi:hypothetical protein